MTAHHDLAERFFTAIERDDMATVGALYADDIRIWHSFDNVAKGRTDGIAMVDGLAVLGRVTYNVIERIVAGDRIVQRHELLITPWDGSDAHRLDAAIFLTVSGNIIRAIDEFLDSEAVSKVLTAIEVARANAK